LFLDIEGSGGLSDKQEPPVVRRVLVKYVLATATGDSWDYLDEVSGDLVNTKPSTLAGIMALCRYLEPLLNDPDLTDLPKSIDWDDETQSTPAGAFANVIAAAVDALVRRAA
jgi:hypothetical protein